MYKLSESMMRKIWALLLVLLSGVAWAQTQDAWWHQVPANVAKNDGSVTLTDANGNPVSMVANPTAAVVKPNQAAVTQPPTVIVQATTGYWKDPVASWALLPTTGNSVGDARTVTGLGLAFTWNGTTWTPLAADQNDNMTAATFIPTMIATAGQPCSNPGQHASSGSGPLFCQSGVWVAGGEKRICNGDGCAEVFGDGTITAWGTGVTGTDGLFAVTLPTAFATVPIITVSECSAGGWGPDNVTSYGAFNQTSLSFDVIEVNWNGTVWQPRTGGVFCWLASGY